MKRRSVKWKIISLALILTMLTGIFALPINAVSNDIANNVYAASRDAPTSVPDHVETVSKNPYDVDVTVRAYPVMTSARYNRYLIWDTVNAVNDKPYVSYDEYSPYYTASIGVWYNFIDIDRRPETAQLESNLPYRDERNKMVHPELVITDTDLSFKLSSAYRNGSDNSRDILSSYITSELGMDPDQLQLRIGATLLYGYGTLSTYTGNGNDRVYKSFDATKGKVDAYLDIPYADLAYDRDIRFNANPRYINGAAVQSNSMTGLHLALIDDYSPSVAATTVRRYDNADGTGDIEIAITMNEGLRFTSMEAKDRLDEIWIEVSLYNLTTKKYSTARLHLKELDNRTMVFRGNIGYYNYNNFRVSRISKVNIPGANNDHVSAYVDAAGKMYVSSYETKDYGNRVYSSDHPTFMYDPASIKTTLICDHAGNPIQTSSITNWTLGDQSFIKNTFEAVKVELYADTAYAKLIKDPDPKLNTSDLFVGPSSNLNAFVYLDTVLSSEEAKKVSITLNIKDENGENVIVYTTGSQNYRIDEIYASGTEEGTLLIFESIDFKEGMKLDVQPGADPIVKIISLNDDIENRTAYPTVVASESAVYADFTAPVYDVRYVGEGTVEKEGGKNYWVTAEISINDIEDFERISGLGGSTISLSIGGGVRKETKIRYILSDSALLPPDEKTAANYPCEATISEAGFASLKFTTSDGASVFNYPVLEDSAKYYLHIFVEGGEILIDNFLVRIGLEDLMGNSVDPTETELIEYLIDEVPPEMEFETVKRSSVYDELLGKSVIGVTLGVIAKDNSSVDVLEYCIGEDPNAADTVWQPLVIKPREPGDPARADIELRYGGASDDLDKVYDEIIWVRAVDYYGNRSEPIAREIVVSVEKPLTDSSAMSDLNKADRAHKIIVNGPPVSELEGLTAYTRVYVTPLDDPGYSYMTIVKTGESADILGFVGLDWYKVKIGADNRFTEVYGKERVDENYVLTEQSILYGLFTYYGEVKISFENGFGSMTPVEGEYLYTAASAGSYIKDPAFYIARYVSPYYTGKTVHEVDFLEIVDRDNNVVVADADKGTDPYLFLADRKGVSPMRNTRIHYSVTNVLNAGYALNDFDYSQSFAELIRIGLDGEERVVSTTIGLAATADQYFILKNTYDNGEHYESGAYYLKVTVKSHGGRTDVFESSRLVLDAQTADNAGLWQYSRQSIAGIAPDYYDPEKPNQSVVWSSVDANGAPITDLGVSVIIEGEQMRSSVFAVYSYGVSALSLILMAPDTEKTIEGITIGGLDGFKLWNLASAPTLEDINSVGFELTTPIGGSPYFSRTNGLDKIYDETTIPKGAEGLRDLYLVRGVNTICYQYKLDNGYVSAVKYFTVTVSEHSPELNIAIDSYRISHEASENPAVINAHSVRFFVESAYSLNGNVSVELWSNYGMNVGLIAENGVRSERFLEDPTPLYQTTPVKLTDMKIDDYADFTENSYTADFPRNTSLCTALFIAYDEFGGVTMVAPQIGDQVRYGNSGSVYGWEIYNIDYQGRYFDDPYDLTDGKDTYRYYYNEPQYFGNQILSFDTYLSVKSDNGEIRMKDIMISNAEVAYNLFNIVTNDVSYGVFKNYVRDQGSYSAAETDKLNNGDLIDFDNSTITFFGGDLSAPVTLPLTAEDNTVGYMGTDVDGSTLSVKVASPRKYDGSPASVTRSFVINGVNRYGDSFVIEGSIVLYYIDYTAIPVMGETGAILDLSFQTREYGSSIPTGQYDAADNLTYSATDMYGNVIDGSFSVNASDVTDPGTSVTVSQANSTVGPVIIKIQRPGVKITVDVTDHDIMSVEYGDAGEATVTLLGNTRFSYRYINGAGEQQTEYITVNNIVKIAPVIVWDYSPDDYTETADGIKFRYGSVTAYLVNPGLTLKDRYTGAVPKHTFSPADARIYTFKAEDITASLNGESVVLQEDVTVVLPITLYDMPDVTGATIEDKEAPNVQVIAYKVDGAYSDDTRLALQLESARNSDALTDRTGYEIFNYTGNRASAASLLRALGWAPALRFEIEILDLSRVRIFIKEGLYAEAPDFYEGVSDDIPGVSLQSRLLNVTANAKFTLFVVDARGNSSAIAFDVTDVGLAPAPTLNKVLMTDALGNSFIRAYITPPDGYQEFEILGSYSVKVESEGEYTGTGYIDFKDNELFTVPYRLHWNDSVVNGFIDVTVTEINLRELSQHGETVWSDNRAQSILTPYDVTATATFSEALAEVKATSPYDENTVQFHVSGSTLTVIYKDNHPAISLVCYAANGSRVFLELGAVDNINKNAPHVEIADRELAKDGKSVLITFRSDIRAAMNGYSGTEREDGKFYFESRITANGDFTYTFGAENGVTTAFSFTVDELVLIPLTVQISLHPDGSDPIDNAAGLDVEVGDTIYVNPLRDATLALGGVIVDAKAGRWTPITVPETLSGVRPYLILTDAYGNTLTQQLERLPILDTSAPEIMIVHTTYSVRIGSDPEAVRAELLSNFAAIDDTDGEITYEVSFDTDLTAVGIFKVEYSATDAAGNTATRSARLRVTSLREPQLTYNGNSVFRDGSLILSTASDIKLNVNSSDLYYKVVIADGINTVAQMKPYGTTVKGYSLDDEIDLGKLDAGVYTLAIVNQERDFFIIYLAIVEPEE